MGNCKIVNCGSKKGEKTFFNVPHDPSIRQQWINQIRRHQQFNDIPISYPVCSLHFEPDEIVRTGKRTTLKKGTVPTIFPGSDGNPVLFEFESQQLQLPDQHHDLQLLSIEPVLNTKANNVFTFESEIESPHTIEQTTLSSKCETGLSARLRSTLVPQKENEVPHDANVIKAHSFENVQQQPSRDILISRTEYSRLLRAEVQGMRFKESCQSKASEIKKLQMQVAYYKKQMFNRTSEEPKEPEPDLSADVN